MWEARFCSSASRDNVEDPLQADELDGELLGRAGRIRFSGSAWCQTYMTIGYELADGKVRHRTSCDLSCLLCYSLNHWYNATMRLEPGARNVEVSFDVRGGGKVCEVDRSKLGCPWKVGGAREMFRFSLGDDLEVEFELSGTSLHRYVSKATRNVDNDWVNL